MTKTEFFKLKKGDVVYHVCKFGSDRTFWRADKIKITSVEKTQQDTQPIEKIITCDEGTLYDYEHEEIFLKNNNKLKNKLKELSEESTKLYLIDLERYMDFHSKKVEKTKLQIKKIQKEVKENEKD